MKPPVRKPSAPAKTLLILLPLSWQGETLKHLLGQGWELTTRLPADFEHAVFQLFGFGSLQKPPVATLTALAQGLPALQGAWLRADPVELTVDAGNAYLVGSTHLQLTLTEMDALQHLLHGLLAEDGLQLHMLNAHEWCLQLSGETPPTTYSLSQVAGKTIRDYLPYGAAAKKWRMLLTETQMVLSASSVNRQRLLQRRPLVSSLWFWGEGTLPAAKPTLCWQYVWSHSALLQGLSLFTDTAIGEPPLDIAQCLAQMQAGGAYLLDLSHSLVTEEKAFEEKALLQPLTVAVQALQAGELRELTIRLGNGDCYRAKKQPRWRKLLTWR